MRGEASERRDAVAVRERKEEEEEEEEADATDVLFRGEVEERREWGAVRECSTLLPQLIESRVEDRLGGGGGGRRRGKGQRAWTREGRA